MGSFYHQILLLLVVISIREMFAKFNPVVLDVTDVINKLANGSDCTPQSLESVIMRINTDVIFFETSCQTVLECIHQINNITSTLHTAILLNKCKRQIYPNQTIIFSIQITENNEERMCRDKWEETLPLAWPCGRIAVVITCKFEEPCVSLHNNLSACFFNLRSALKQAIHPKVPVGLGFDRMPLLCKHHYQPCFDVASFFVITEQVGYSSAKAYNFLAESLIGYQQNGSSSQAAIKHEDETCSNQLFSLVIRHHKVGQFCETNVEKYLKEFLQSLETSQDKNVGLVLSPFAFTPTYNSGIHTLNLIGVIKQNQCFEMNVVGCYGVSTVQLLLEQFSALILEYGQWESIQKVLINNPDVSMTPGLLAHALIDYSHAKQSGVLEMELQNLVSINKLSEKFKITSLILPLDPIDYVEIKNSPIDIVPTDDWDLVKNVSAEIPVLCSSPISDPALHYSNNAVSVRKYTDSITLRCAGFGGSNFLLDIEVDMYTGVEMDFSNSFYKNEILTPLMYALEVREYLWLRDPSLKPYIRMSFRLMMLSSLLTDRKLESAKELELTVFCNKKALKLNELFIDIQAWSSFHGFPVILKSAFSDPEFSYPTSWLTNLMPNFFDISTDFFTTQYPIFVPRDYPKAFSGFASEPCIEWGQGPPIVGDNFFLNTSLGATLDFRFSEKETVTNEEGQTILKFLFHKFQMVEILIGSMKEALLFREAISMDVIETVKEEDNQHQIFLDYLVSNDKNESFHTLSNILHTIEHEIKIPNLKCGGVILNVLNIESLFPVNISESLLNTTSVDYINVLVDSAAKISNNVGLALECEKLLPILLQNESKIYLSLDKVQYLVCYALTTVYDFEKDELAREFDTFLYTQKVLARYYPNLTLVFRIYPLVDLNEITMKQYVQFLFYMQQLGAQYNIKFFPLRAFDSSRTKNGWWTIDSYTDLTNVSVYHEKEAEYSNRETWRPGMKRHETVDRASRISLMTSIVISSLAFVLLILCLVGAFMFIRFKRIKLLLSDQEVKDILYGRLGRTDEGVKIEGNFANEHLSMMLKFDFRYELAKGDIVIDSNKIMGLGHFGTVFKGFAKGNPVAIKEPKKGCSATTLKTFISEVNVLCYIGNHQNIVNFVGAYIREAQRGFIQVATELCPNGSLESYLRKKERVVNLNEDISGIPAESVILIYDMYRFCSEIAAGMQHIAEKHFFHGDLASRNVLLDTNFTCKICDFGFSRKLYNYETYIQASQVPLPWRWAAYEVLSKREFSIQSDVWSFGITMWEIFTLGNFPYADYNLSTEFIAELKQGLRLSKPEYASVAIYSKLQECWDIKPEQRPKFNLIGDFFKNLCSGQYSTVDIV